MQASLYNESTAAACRFSFSKCNISCTVPAIMRVNPDHKEAHALVETGDCVLHLNKRFLKYWPANHDNCSVRIERHSERILVLKMVLGDRLLNVFSVYAPHAGKPEEEKESFWDNVFHLLSCISQNEMVVFAGDTNAGYDGTHGGFGYGSTQALGYSLVFIYLFVVIII